MVAVKSPEWLPPGFAEKVKYKNGRKIKYYYNVATGAKYHSKKDVLSCATASNGLLGTPQTTNGDDNKLSSNNKVDAAMLVKTNDSPDWLPNGWKMEEKTRQSGSRKGTFYKVYTELSSGSKFYSRAAVTRYMKSVDHANMEIVQNKVDNVDEPVPDVSSQCVSMTKTGHDIPGKKKNGSFKTVAIESTAADDLPPGWIKEIKTSKSGNRIRKDPFYTDPVSGYVFRSKLDALRYLKTNDIASCACRPKKRESDDLKLITNEIPSSSQANEKLSEHKRELFPDGELNDGGESSDAKNQVKSAAKVSKQTQDNNESDSVKVTSNRVEEKISHENAKMNAEVENKPEPANEVSKGEPREIGVKNRIDRTPANSRKSKKRRDLSLPSRTSKRLAGGEPELVSNSVLDERSLRASARRTSGIKVDSSPAFSPKDSATTQPSDQPSKIEPSKQDAKHEHLQVLEQPSQVENDTPAIPEEKVVQKQPEDSKRPQDSQLCFDFGDSWSDPLEFALKTLRGEIPINDPLAFSGGFDEQLSIPHNQSSRSSQSDAPIVFRNEFVPPPESSKQKSPINQFAPDSSSFSDLGNIWSGFNSQPSVDTGKKDCSTKFNP